MKSLKAIQHELSPPLVQLGLLDKTKSSLPTFKSKMSEIGLLPLRPKALQILQINLGKMCNQTCSHCHVDAGPDRTEIMTSETMESCLAVLKESDIRTVDLTGGAPEMNPNFRWFVEEITRLSRSVMVRSNLTILTANHKYLDLPKFFAENRVTVVSSLPCYTAKNTDKQRGSGTFEKSIRALRMLNSVGYGDVGTGLELHLVYNPLGAFLPPAQEKLRADYKKILKTEFGISFNELFCITNMPINRFLQSLIQSGHYESYMGQLVEAFNPKAAFGVMCTNTLSVGWDGILYDCDFNQMLELPVSSGSSKHIKDLDLKELEKRSIVVNQHCFGCTAGAGSSCGGEII